jgi:hypothetical protein
MMNEIRLTRRGKIAAVIAAGALVVSINALAWGKGVSCDWRESVEACSVQALPTAE